MTDFDSFLKEQLANPEVAREYYRLAPFYRLADQLLLLRKKRGINQQELAVKADTTQAVVSRLENATVHCSLETVVRLAEALDAVVEVKLKPLEELANKADDAEADEHGDIEEMEEEDKKGVVYFGRVVKKPSQNLLWCDPISQGLFSPQEYQKRRIPEFA
jgi:transcriptional regulator with XRE-family HTH domain